MYPMFLCKFAFRKLGADRDKIMSVRPIFTVRTALWNLGLVRRHGIHFHLTIKNARRGCSCAVGMSVVIVFRDEMCARNALMLVAGRWSLVAGRWSLVAGRWSLVAGRWSLVAGRWSLVAGRWSLVAGRERLWARVRVCQAVLRVFRRFVIRLTADIQSFHVGFITWQGSCRQGLF